MQYLDDHHKWPDGELALVPNFVNCWFTQNPNPTRTAAVIGWMGNTPSQFDDLLRSMSGKLFHRHAGGIDETTCTDISFDIGAYMFCADDYIPKHFLGFVSYYRKAKMGRSGCDHPEVMMASRVRAFASVIGLPINEAKATMHTESNRSAALILCEMYDLCADKYAGEGAATTPKAIFHRVKRYAKIALTHRPLQEVTAEEASFHMRRHDDSLATSRKKWAFSGLPEPW